MAAAPGLNGVLEAGARRRRAALLCLSAFGIASVAVIAGIGGGLFCVPLLHYGFKLPIKRAVATSLCLVFTSASVATVTQAVHPEAVLHLSVIALLAPAALLGAQLGIRIARAVAPGILKAIFCVAFAFAGYKLLVSAEPRPANPEFALQLASATRLIVLGLMAGILVPLLGIGGGMVMVPGLLFLLPDLGHSGARSTSLAVGSITALRSLWLYTRAGLVDWGTGGWFIPGAVAGAVTGTLLAQVPALEPYAQMFLGAVLAVSAVRFALDVRSSLMKRTQA